MALKTLYKDGKPPTLGGKTLRVDVSAADSIQHADIPDYVKAEALSVAEKVKAVLQPDMEEERRLFYVGMTRAKRSLTLCSVKTLHNKKVELSRFLKEAGAETLPKE